MFTNARSIHDSMKTSSTIQNIDKHIILTFCKNMSTLRLIFPSTNTPREHFGISCYIFLPSINLVYSKNNFITTLVNKTSPRTVTDPSDKTFSRKTDRMNDYAN